MSTRPRVSFYFDVVCPYAYLASTQIEAICRAGGAELVLKPVLLGGIYQALRPDSPTSQSQSHGPARVRHSLIDLARNARYYGVPLVYPAEHPRRTLAAMRLLVAAERTGDAARLSSLMHALYRANWAESRDIADAAVLAEISGAHGLDPAVMEDPDVKARLRANTEEAVRRDAFGVPTMVVEDAPGAEGTQVLWGQDRLLLVEEYLGVPADQRRAPDERRLPQVEPHGRVVDFYYDISSPYSYLAATQIEAVAARAGGSVSFRPFLLGGLFKSIGTPIPPLIAFSDPQRRHQGMDLYRWAKRFGVPYQWPPDFPINTVTCLRMLAAVEDADRARLTHAFFRAYWAEGRNVADKAVLTEVAGGAGFDAAALLARADDPAVKARVIENGAAALSAGAYGAPTYVVSGAKDDPMFFGQDRLSFVAQALAGRD